MQKRVYFLFLIVYILLSSFCRLNGQTYSDLYDLHFKIAKDTNTEIFYPWRINAAYTYHSFYPSYRGKNLYTVRYDSTLASTKQLEFELEQRILLPTHNAKQGKVTFKGLGDSLKESYLVIEGLNYQEKTIFSDTLRMQLSADHKTFSKDILFKDTELLNLRFHIEGEEKKNASIGFSRVDILIGDKSIDTFPIRKLANSIDLKEYVPINLNSNKAFDKINILKKKKIIGLGESIHRNTCINNLAYQFIEEQVKNEKCRLVLVERNIEKSLIYNRYVNGGNIEIENYVDSNYEDKYFLNFLDKIRKYNQDKKESERVNLFGIDYNYFLDKDNNSFDDIFYYITALNNELRKKELDMLALTLIEGGKDEALSFLYKNKEVLETILTPKDYQTILLYAKLIL